MPQPSNLHEILARALPGEVTRITGGPFIFRVSTRTPRRRTQAQIERAAYRQMMREEAQIQRDEERANRY